MAPVDGDHLSDSLEIGVDLDFEQEAIVFGRFINGFLAEAGLMCCLMDRLLGNVKFIEGCSAGRQQLCQTMENYISWAGC